MATLGNSVTNLPLPPEKEILSRPSCKTDSDLQAFLDTCKRKEKDDYRSGFHRVKTVQYTTVKRFKHVDSKPSRVKSILCLFLAHDRRQICIRFPFRNVRAFIPSIPVPSQTLCSNSQAKIAPLILDNTCMLKHAWTMCECPTARCPLPQSLRQQETMICKAGRKGLPQNQPEHMPVVSALKRRAL